MSDIILYITQFCDSITGLYWMRLQKCHYDIIHKFKYYDLLNYTKHDSKFRIINIKIINLNYLKLCNTDITNLEIDNTYEPECKNLDHIIILREYYENISLLSKFQKLKSLTINKLNTIIKYYPSHLQILKLGDDYKLKLGDLPLTLHTLVLGLSYNYELPLIKNLTSLEVSHNYDRCLNLNEGLLSLTLGYNFDQILELPSSLKYLYIGESYNKNLNLSIAIDTLRFSPSSYFNSNFIPNKNLKTLIFGFYYSQNIDFLHELQHLEHLELDYCFNLPINKLPPNLKTLKLGDLFNNSIAYSKTLKNLWLGENFEGSLSQFPNLEILQFTNNKFYLPKAYIPGFRLQNSTPTHNLPTNCEHIIFWKKPTLGKLQLQYEFKKCSSDRIS
jgi:hypothetical protein